MAKVRKTAKEAPPPEPIILKSGEELTPELEEQLSAEAERGYDPAKWRREYVGRPSLGDSGISPRVSFRASPELYKAAWKRADAEGRSLSDIARQALQEYLKP
jgi:hypothetical protein